MNLKNKSVVTRCDNFYILTLDLPYIERLVLLSFNMLNRTLLSVKEISSATGESEEDCLVSCKSLALKSYLETRDDPNVFRSTWKIGPMFDYKILDPNMTENQAMLCLYIHSMPHGMPIKNNKVCDNSCLKPADLTRIINKLKQEGFIKEAKMAGETVYTAEKRIEEAISFKYKDINNAHDFFKIAKHDISSLDKLILFYLSEIGNSLFDGIQDDLNLTRGQSIKALRGLKQKHLIRTAKKFGITIYGLNKEIFG